MPHSTRKAGAAHATGHASTGCTLIADGPDLPADAAPYAPPPAFFLWLARGIALLALGIAVYFLWASAVAGGTVAGCGDAADAGCGHVLSSRWSQWLRLPVSLPAAVLYALTLLALFGIGREGTWPGAHRAWPMLVTLAATLAGAACWFLGLQVLVLGSFCGYCVTAHVCGLLLAGLVFWYSPIRRRPAAPALILLGFAGTGVLVAGQLLVAPRSPDMRVGRTVELEGGKISLDVENHPRLGSAQAKYVVVELYDYTCEHCRATAVFLEEARRRYGEQLTILPLVVPLSPACNRYVQSMKPPQKHACEYARLALAVWRADPRAFETYHRWLTELPPPPPEDARQYAEELVGGPALARALSDGWLNRQLKEHARIYAQFGGGALPKLLYGSQTAQGQPATAQQLFDFLEKEVGLRPSPTSP